MIFNVLIAIKSIAKTEQNTYIKDGYEFKRLNCNIHIGKAYTVSWEPEGRYCNSNMFR